MSKHLWPDGKHKHWNTLHINIRANILRMINNKKNTDEILAAHPYITIGTIAAVKANLNR